jgi:antitoxin component of MazEF toxin-antitoxin module
MNRPMIKTLKPIGNSYGVIIERPIMDLLGITPDTPLEITVTKNGPGLEIRPVAPAGHPARVREAMTEVMDTHAETLKRLAE